MICSTTPTKPSPPARQQRRLWRHVESIENFWEHLEEIEPGAVQRLGTVAHERRWRVIFLTKRPETVGAIAQVQSQRWLESRGFTLPSVYVVQGSRGRIAASLGLDIASTTVPRTASTRRRLEGARDSGLAGRRDAAARRHQTARDRRGDIGRSG